MRTDTDNDPTPDEFNRPRRAYRPGPHWFAFFAAVSTWPLLFIGGLVTTYRVGMAVPDWPTTFGINMFLYDMTQATWAVFGEHTHRLYGAAVGVFTILLMVDLLAFDRRRWMKGLGVLALVAVIAQGVLGGLRVRYNSTLLAAVHGSTAQAFFGLMAALVVLTGRGWFAEPREAAGSGKIRRLSAALLVMLFVQVIVGAWLRHYADIRALAAHAAMALAVFGHASGLYVRIERRRDEFPELVPAARAMAVLIFVQMALGFLAWSLLRPYDGIAREVTLPQALIRTGHQANAGLLLASVVVLTLRAFGNLAGPTGRNRSAGTTARDLEAVA